MYFKALVRNFLGLKPVQNKFEQVHKQPVFKAI